MADDVNRALGVLQGEVKFLTDTWRQQDATATEGRRALYEKVEVMIKEMMRLTGRVDAIADELEALKPVVAASDRRHQQAVGSKKIIAIVWTSLIALVSALTAGLLELVHRVWPLPPAH